MNVSELYDADFALWLEVTTKLLKAQDFQKLDLLHLIEEIEGLGNSQRQELENRLTTLYEHLLKRQYVNLPECYRGWASTIKRTQIRMSKLFKVSPSLKNHYWICKDECYHDALAIVKTEYDVEFPEYCPFLSDLEQLLNSSFWE